MPSAAGQWKEETLDHSPVCEMMMIVGVLTCLLRAFYEFFTYLGPRLNKRLLSVHCPSGLKKADLNFFHHFFFLNLASTSESINNEKQKGKNPNLMTGSCFAHPVDGKLN